MNCRLRTIVKSSWEKLLTKLFIDNILLYKYVRCHRRSSRSFFLRNRQFHVCSRCTGLIVGYAISPFCLFFGEYTFKIFIISSTALILDGLTQLFGWRESNNKLRFITGLGTGATSLSLIWMIIRYVLKLN